MLKHSPPQHPIICLFVYLGIRDREASVCFHEDIRACNNFDLRGVDLGSSTSPHNGKMKRRCLASSLRTQCTTANLWSIQMENDANRKTIHPLYEDWEWSWDYLNGPGWGQRGWMQQNVCCWLELEFTNVLNHFPFQFQNITGSFSPRVIFLHSTNR